MKKILLIRFSSIGDIVLTTPVIRCLKNQLHVELHILTRKNNHHLFTNNPYVDQIYSYENSLSEVIPRLKKEAYDHVVDLHKNLRSFRVRLALMRPASSFPKLNVKKYLLVRFKINRMPDIHIVDRYFEAVKPLGISNDGKGLDYFIPEQDCLQLADLPEPFRKGFVAVVIGGKHTTKVLPASKVISVCQKVSCPVILLGGQEDAETGSLIVDALGNRAWNSCGLLNLHQSASVLRLAKSVLTNDTGLMHIAAAFKKPIVSVWGNTLPELGMYPYLPAKEAPSVIIENKKLDCRPCSKIGFNQCPKGHFKCMLDLDEQKIAEAINKLSQSTQTDC